MDGPSRRPTDSSRSEGTPSLSEVPSGGSKTFWLLLGRLPKVTRCKSGTLSGRYRSNGYALTPTAQTKAHPSLHTRKRKLHTNRNQDRPHGPIKPMPHPRKSRAYPLLTEQHSHQAKPRSE